MTIKHTALERLRRHADEVEARMMRGIEQAPNQDERMRRAARRAGYLSKVEAEEANIIASIEANEQHLRDISRKQQRRQRS